MVSHVLVNTKYLRFAAIIIAVVCTISELLSLTISMAVVITTHLLDHGDDISRVLLYRFLFFLFTLISFLKLFLCATLVVGLRMRLPDHLELWYKGISILEVWRAALVIFIITYLRKTSSAEFWVAVAGKLLITATTIFFTIVVRYYCHQMRREPNYYQDLSCKAYKTGSYYEKPKETNNDDVLIYPTLAESHDVQEKSGMQKKRGSLVFSTSESANVLYPALPPTKFFLDDKRQQF